MWIAINGQLVRQEEAVVSVYDHGFLYGMGCFETFRTYEGKSFLLHEHMERLRGGLRELDIFWNVAEQKVEQQINELLEVNGLNDGYFRLSVSAGIGEIGLSSTPYVDPVTVLYVKPLPPVPEKLYVQGKPLAVLRTPRVQPETSVRLKSFHYMSSLIAKKELVRKPWADRAEGLFLTPEGYAAEGMTRNLFFVRDGAVFTPSVDTGILPGITRNYVIKLLREQCSITVHEGFYTWEELLAADEIFITSSIQELVPISRLYDLSGNGRKVGSGAAGYKTTHWLNLYRNKARGR